MMTYSEKKSAYKVILFLFFLVLSKFKFRILKKSPKEHGKNLLGTCVSL